MQRPPWPNRPGPLRPSAMRPRARRLPSASPATRRANCPGLPSSSAGGRSFRCQGTTLAALPTRLPRDGPTLLPALVMKESPALGRHAFHLLLVGVAEGATVRLAAFRPDGTEVLGGEAVRRTWAFRMGTIAGAAYPPVAVEGVLGTDGRLAFARLEVGAWRAPSAVPRPDPGPTARP